VAIFTRPHEDTSALPPVSVPRAGNGHGPHGGPLGSARSTPRRRWGWLVMAAVAAAATLVGVEASAGTGTYPVRAVFAQAPGLFPGASVEMLGVPIGTVTSVRNVQDQVTVGLAIDRGRPVPARASATLVSPEILGEPSIDLAPGYTGGPQLRSGAVIPMSRTAVPVSTEQVLKSLESMLKKVNPNAVGNLVTNLAQDLHGQGKNLNTLIAGAAGTLKLLATKADDLGQLDGSLAQLTGTLDSRTSEITRLITDYDTVSGVIAQHSSQLGGAIQQLSEASTALIQVLVPNLGPVESDVGSVTRVGRTLDRNLTSVDETLSAATALFAGAERAYTPAHNWLTLGLQTPAGLTGAILAEQVESRLEGVCRRILAHHATDLTAQQRQTLATCGNPASAFFEPIADQVPTILSDVSAGKLPTSATPAQMLQQGLSKIEGATSAGSKPSASSSKSSSGSSTSTGGGSGPKTRTASSTKTKKKTKTCLGGLLDTLVKCTTGTTKTGKTTKTARTTKTSTGSGTTLGNLLSYRAPVSRAANAPAALSLTASAASDLPPLPAAAPGASATTPTTHRWHRTHRSRRAHRRRSNRSSGPPPSTKGATP
jgi:phospholipid/cholesterol/gamma-HCH transport system substrate-binding protein